MMQYPKYTPVGWVQPSVGSPIRRKWKYILLAVMIVALVSVSAYIILIPQIPGISITSDQQAALLAGDINNEIQDINNTLTILELAIT
jgi:hypothetical protein